MISWLGEQLPVLGKDSVPLDRSGWKVSYIKLIVMDKLRGNIKCNQILLISLIELECITLSSSGL
jgi:hypothetical protein